MLIALIPALSGGDRRYERALAAGVLGAFLITPYLNSDDLTLLFVCAWLVLNGGASVRMRLGLLVAYPFVALVYLVGPIPLLLVELAWLLALAGDGLGAQPMAFFRRDPAQRPSVDGRHDAAASRAC